MRIAISLTKPKGHTVLSTGVVHECGGKEGVFNFFKGMNKNCLSHS